MGKKKERNLKGGFWWGVLYALLGMILFFQIMVFIAVTVGSNIVDFDPPAQIREAKWLAPMLVATTLLIFVSVYLCRVWRNKEKLSLVPMTFGLVGAVLALVISLTFRAAYDHLVGADGAIALTDWEWFWRHFSMVIVGAVTATISFINHRRIRGERIRKENESYLETFNFDEDNPLLDESKKEKKKSKKERRAEKA